MRFILTIVIFLSAVLDTCLDEAIAHGSEGRNTAAESVLAAHTPCAHVPTKSSHDSGPFDTHASHQCHVGHCGWINTAECHLPQVSVGKWISNYKFVVPSAYLRTLRRPPKQAV